MKKLALLVFLVAPSLYAADKYVAAVGGDGPEPSGTAYTLAAPGFLENIMNCDGTYKLQPGDRVWLRGGTYTGGLVGNASKYVLRGRCTGREEANMDIQFAPYEDPVNGLEHVIFECAVDMEGNDGCVGVSVSTGTAQVLTVAPSTVIFKYGSVGAFLTGTSWVDRIIEVNPPSRIPSTEAPSYYRITSVTDTTHLEVTPIPPSPPLPTIAAATCSSNDKSGCYDLANLQFREFVTFIGGFEVRNTSTDTRFNAHGHAQFTEGNADITFVDGSNTWYEGTFNSSTGNVTGTGTTVSRTLGDFFCRVGCANGNWPGKPVIVAGVPYTIATVDAVPAACTSQCTQLTLTAPAPLVTGTTIRTPHGEFTDIDEGNDFWLVGTEGPQDSGGSPTSYRNLWCADDTHCTLAAPFPATGCDPDPSPCTKESQWPGRGFDTRTRGGGPNMGMTGGKWINNFQRDTGGGTNWGSAYHHGKMVWYGNIQYFQGGISFPRGSGHGHYLQHRIQYNEPSRSFWSNNLVYRPFYLGGQIYSEDGAGLNSFITLSNNIYVANGHAGYPRATFYDTGGFAGGGVQYVGSVTQSPTAGCPDDYAWPDRKDLENGVVHIGLSNKTAKGITLTHNLMYNPGFASFNWGGGKGSCRSIITKNIFINSEGPVFLRNTTFENAAGTFKCTVAAPCGTYDPIQIGGTSASCCTADANTFMSNVPLSDPTNGAPALSFDRTHYPDNHFYASIAAYDAAIGSTDLKFYAPNSYKLGKGQAAVYQADDSATVQVDLCQMGGFVNEKWEVYNGQCAIPWGVCTPLLAWDTSGAAESACPSGNCQAINVCPYNVTVPSTLAQASRLRPGYTDKDGVTPMPYAPDVGPELVLLTIENDVSTVASTPTPVPTDTPTITSTPTRTVTNTPSLTPSRTFTPTQTFTRTNTPTGTLTPSLTPTRTPTSVFTLTASATPTRTATPLPGQVQGLTINPALCTVTDPMVVTVTGEYPGTYVSSADQYDGIIECPFTVPSTGVWYPFAKTFDSDGVSDSFFFSMDDSDPASGCNQPEGTDAVPGCSQIFDTASSKDQNDSPPCIRRVQYGVLGYKKWNNRGGSDGVCSGEGSQWSINLTSGVTHTLRVRQRDPDARLYYIQWSQDANFEPGDPQPTPTPDFSGQGPNHRHPCGYKSGGKHWIVTHRHPPTVLDNNHTHDLCGVPIH